MIPKLRADTQILAIDTSSTSQTYLVKSGDRQFEISETLHQFTRLIDGKRTVEEIAEAFIHESDKECTPLDAERIIEHYLVPHGLIIKEDGTEASPSQKSYLYISTPLFSQKLLTPITNILKGLFAPRLFYPALIALVVFHVYFYLVAHRPPFTFRSIGGSDVILVYGAIFLTSLFHELGHSSACHYFGAKHGAIGLGLYLYIPVFYADVSDVWKLNRRERAVVDFAGMYFQLLTIPLFYVVGVIAENSGFLLIIYALNFSIVTSLNPLLRFDGYWLAADISGIPNLRKRSQRVVTHMFQKLSRRSQATTPTISDLHLKARYFLYSYAFLSNAFFVFFTYQIVRFLPDLLSTYPSDIFNFFAALPRELSTGNFSAIGSDTSSLLFPTLVFTMIWVMLYRLLFTLVRLGSKWVNLTILRGEHGV